MISKYIHPDEDDKEFKRELCKWLRSLPREVIIYLFGLDKKEEDISLKKYVTINYNKFMCDIEEYGASSNFQYCLVSPEDVEVSLKRSILNKKDEYKYFLELKDKYENKTTLVEDNN